MAPHLSHSPTLPSGQKAASPAPRPRSAEGRIIPALSLIGAPSHNAWNSGERSGRDLGAPWRKRCPTRFRRSGRVEAARPDRRGRLPSKCTSARSRPRGLLARSRRKRIDWIKPPTKIKNVAYTGNVPIHWFEDGIAQRLRQLPRPPPAPRAATRPRSSGRATIPSDDSDTITYAELHEQVCRLANVLQGAGRQEGRPRHHLHADDPRGGRRDARLRAHRRGPFGGLRRLLAGLARRPHPGLRLQRRHHRRRGPARRQARCRSRQRRRGAGASAPACEHVHRRAPHRRPGRAGCRGATSGTTTAAAQRDRRTARPSR